MRPRPGSVAPDYHLDAPRLRLPVTPFPRCRPARQPACRPAIGHELPLRHADLRVRCWLPCGDMSSLSPIHGLGTTGLREKRLAAMLPINSYPAHGVLAPLSRLQHQHQKSLCNLSMYESTCPYYSNM